MSHHLFGDRAEIDRFVVNGNLNLTRLCAESAT
jgi:hypothetical protein